MMGVVVCKSCLVTCEGKGAQPQACLLESQSSRDNVPGSMHGTLYVTSVLFWAVHAGIMLCVV